MRLVDKFSKLSKYLVSQVGGTNMLQNQQQQNGPQGPQGPQTPQGQNPQSLIGPSGKMSDAEALQTAQQMKSEGYGEREISDHLIPAILPPNPSSTDVQNVDQLLKSAADRRLSSNDRWYDDGTLRNYHVLPAPVFAVIVMHVGRATPPKEILKYAVAASKNIDINSSIASKVLDDQKNWGVDPKLIAKIEDTIASGFEMRAKFEAIAGKVVCPKCGFDKVKPSSIVRLVDGKRKSIETMECTRCTSKFSDPLKRNPKVKDTKLNIDSPSMTVGFELLTKKIDAFYGSTGKGTKKAIGFWMFNPYSEPLPSDKRVPNARYKPLQDTRAHNQKNPSMWIKNPHSKDPNSFVQVYNPEYVPPPRDTRKPYERSEFIPTQYDFVMSMLKQIDVLEDSRRAVAAETKMQGIDKFQRDKLDGVAKSYASKISKLGDVYKEMIAQYGADVVFKALEDYAPLRTIERGFDTRTGEIKFKGHAVGYKVISKLTADGIADSAKSEAEVVNNLGKMTKYMGRWARHDDIAPEDIDTFLQERTKRLIDQDTLAASMEKEDLPEKEYALAQAEHGAFAIRTDSPELASDPSGKAFARIKLEFQDLYNTIFDEIPGEKDSYKTIYAYKVALSNLSAFAELKAEYAELSGKDFNETLFNKRYKPLPVNSQNAGTSAVDILKADVEALRAKSVTSAAVDKRVGVSIISPESYTNATEWGNKRLNALHANLNKRLAQLSNSDLGWDSKKQETLNDHLRQLEKLKNAPAGSDWDRGIQAINAEVKRLNEVKRNFIETVAKLDADRSKYEALIKRGVDKRMVTVDVSEVKIPDNIMRSLTRSLSNNRMGFKLNKGVERSPGVTPSEPPKADYMAQFLSTKHKAVYVNGKYKFVDTDNLHKVQPSVKYDDSAKRWYFQQDPAAIANLQASGGLLDRPKLETGIGRSDPEDVGNLWGPGDQEGVTEFGRTVKLTDASQIENLVESFATKRSEAWRSEIVQNMSTVPNVPEEMRGLDDKVYDESPEPSNVYVDQTSPAPETESGPDFGNLDAVVKKYGDIVDTALDSASASPKAEAMAIVKAKSALFWQLDDGLKARLSSLMAERLDAVNKGMVETVVRVQEEINDVLKRLSALIFSRARRLEDKLKADDKARNPDLTDWMGQGQILNIPIPMTSFRRSQVEEMLRETYETVDMLTALKVPPMIPPRGYTNYKPMMTDDGQVMWVNPAVRPSGTVKVVDKDGNVNNIDFAKLKLPIRTAGEDIDVWKDRFAQSAGPEMAWARPLAPVQYGQTEKYNAWLGAPSPQTIGTYLDQLFTSTSANAVPIVSLLAMLLEVQGRLLKPTLRALTEYLQRFTTGRGKYSLIEVTDENRGSVPQYAGSTGALTIEGKVYGWIQVKDTAFVVDDIAEPAGDEELPNATVPVPVIEKALQGVADRGAGDGGWVDLSVVIHELRASYSPDAVDEGIVSYFSGPGAAKWKLLEVDQKNVGEIRPADREILPIINGRTYGWFSAGGAPVAPAVPTTAPTLAPQAPVVEIDKDKITVEEPTEELLTTTPPEPDTGFSFDEDEAPPAEQEELDLSEGFSFDEDEDGLYKVKASNGPAGTAANPMDGQRDSLSTTEMEGTGKIGSDDEDNSKPHRRNKDKLPRPLTQKQRIQDEASRGFIDMPYEPGFDAIKHIGEVAWGVDEFKGRWDKLMEKVKAADATPAGVPVALRVQVGKMKSMANTYIDIYKRMAKHYPGEDLSSIDVEWLKSVVSQPKVEGKPPLNNVQESLERARKQLEEIRGKNAK